jgi:phosphoribosylamine--glycine ligase
MKVLVVGGGAREHALCWALRRSERLSALFCAPGNAGTARLAENVPIAAEAVEVLTAWAVQRSIDLVVVGPEVPLAAGLVDRLQAGGLRAFGPSAAAAEIEASKCWSAAFVERLGIPAPRSLACTNLDAGLAAIDAIGLPAAIKADGLAAGKGVVLVGDRPAARQALAWMLDQGGLGSAGQRVLIQEAVRGTELSVLALADGETVLPLPPARDYKRIGEGDRGPNTGGMGAYCPPALATPDLLDRIRRTILEPTVRGLAEAGRPFVGTLYAGLMLTAEGPKVLEYNCRFGDPETQVILPLLESDLLDLLEAASDGALAGLEPRWRTGAACGVVLASGGYPGDHPTGLPIRGLDDLPPEALVFQAGTAEQAGRIVTAGGRVLTVAARGATLALARQAAYKLAAKIDFPGCYYRRDIGADDETLGQTL